MEHWWKWQSEVGEMMGMITFVFSVMMAFHITKKESFGITTVFRRRIFLGTTVALTVLVSASMSLGFGGHGQVNPALTLMVASLDGHFEQVPAIIGFQLIGATIGAILLVIFVKIFDPKTDMKKAFSWVQQPPQKTAGIELFGNMLWLLPIGALLVIMKNAHAGGVGSIDHSFGHYQLFIVAIAGKFLLVAMFEEYGGAVFNSGVWFGKVVVTFIVQKNFPVKAMLSGGAGLVTSLSIGVGVGYFSSLFLK